MSDNRGVVSVRFRSDEIDVVRAAAEARHLTVGAYLKSAAFTEAIMSKPGARRVSLPGGADLAIWTTQPVTSQTFGSGVPGLNGETQ